MSGGAPDATFINGFAPGITQDPTTDPRTRNLGRWLCSVGKGVVSTTLPEQKATWENSRVFRDVRQAVAALKAEPGRDIAVDFRRHMNNSYKLIRI
jgi:hypothetical protein